MDAAGLIRVDGNAYMLARELAQQEVQLLIDDSKIVVTRKARFIIELDKAESVYKPDCKRKISVPLVLSLDTCDLKGCRKHPRIRGED